MASAFDVLSERGFIAQLSHEDEIRALLAGKKVTFYAGFDPTADSLHMGHLLPIMAMAHLQQHGHRPIALVGGGTALIGDPSGREEMRQILTPADVDRNIAHIKKQLGRFIDFKKNRARLVNNGDWLRDINYVSFLRDIGVHFSVNRMLTAECFKQRLEKGLSFLEFNYMLLQAYDFLHLFHEHGCVLQVGGDDQWANILAGADLIRRKEQKAAYAMTFNLITTSSGKKMGKTEKGAVWLDPAKTTPYDYYQYWRNTHDGDVKKFLYLFTFLPKAEVEKLGALRDQEVNESKKVLAFEATKIVHGAGEAEKAQKAAQALFEKGVSGGSIPVFECPSGADALLLDLLPKSGIVGSKTEARKLINQKGLTVDGETVKDFFVKVGDLDKDGDGLIEVRKGKKTVKIFKIR
jgi:tyrosyl-tRNA synthetase